MNNENTRETIKRRGKECRQEGKTKWRKQGCGNNVSYMQEQIIILYNWYVLKIVLKLCMLTVTEKKSASLWCYYGYHGVFMAQITWNGCWKLWKYQSKWCNANAKKFLTQLWFRNQKKLSAQFGKGFYKLSLNNGCVH